MRTSTKLTVFTFVITFFGIVSAFFPIPVDHMVQSKSLNMEPDEIEKKCEARLHNLYKTIVDLVGNINEYLFSYFRDRPEDPISIKYYTCQEDVWLELMLQHLIKLVNLCIDPTHRLEILRVSIYVKSIMRIICTKYDIDFRYSKAIERQCIYQFANKRSICADKFNRLGNNLLHMIYNPQNCSETIKFIDCSNEVFPETSCSEDLINELQYQNNRTLEEIYRCSDQRPMLELLNDNEEVINTKLDPNDNETSRFRLSKAELMEKCDEKGSESKKQLENLLSEFTMFRLKKQLKLSLTARLSGIKSKEKLHILVRETCYNDREIKKMLEKIYDSIELCLDKEVHSTDGTKAKMLIQSRHSMCDAIEIAMWAIPKDACFKNLEIFLKKAMCNKFGVRNQMYSNMPLPFLPSQKECIHLYEIQECELDVFKDCSDSSKIELRKQYNQQRELSGCEEMYELKV